MPFTKIVMKTKHRNSDFDIIVGYRFLFHVTYYYRVSSSVLDEAGTKKKKLVLLVKRPVWGRIFTLLVD